MPRRAIVLTLFGLVVLAGCGGGSPESSTPSRSSTTPADASTWPRPTRPLSSSSGTAGGR